MQMNLAVPKEVYKGLWSQDSEVHWLLWGGAWMYSCGLYGPNLPTVPRRTCNSTAWGILRRGTIWKLLAVTFCNMIFEIHKSCSQNQEAKTTM